jgi:hypothetical protein
VNSIHRLELASRNFAVKDRKGGNWWGIGLKHHNIFRHNGYCNLRCSYGNRPLPTPTFMIREPNEAAFSRLGTECMDESSNSRGSFRVVAAHGTIT